jgi:hypothetical protein
LYFRIPYSKPFYNAQSFHNSKFIVDYDTVSEARLLSRYETQSKLQNISNLHNKAVNLIGRLDNIISIHEKNRTHTIALTFRLTKITLTSDIRFIK